MIDELRDIITRFKQADKQVEQLSVALPALQWQVAGAMGSEAGELLLDVAEMDDIAAVVLIAVFFTLFFFLHIGMSLDASALGAGGMMGGLLLSAAVLSKFSATAILLGVSMIPPAEMALVILQTGRAFGEWAVPSSVFSAMVMVSAGTCLFVPFVLWPLLSEWIDEK